MVISTNDIFSMIIIQVCAMADIPKGYKKADVPTVTDKYGCLPPIAVSKVMLK